MAKTIDERKDFIVDRLRKSGMIKEALKIENCGKDPLFFFDALEKSIYSTGAKCHARLCPDCSTDYYERAKTMVRAFVAHYRRENLRFVTITQLSYRFESLADCIIRLRKNYTSLRRTVFWKGHIKGGLLKWEICHNHAQKTWHVHLHILAITNTLCESALKSKWESITKDSYLCTVDTVRAKSEEEMSKYIAKFEGPVHVSFCELIESTRRIKMIQPFGDAYGKFSIPDSQDSERNLEYLGTLDKCLSRFYNYDVDPILKQLGLFILKYFPDRLAPSDRDAIEERIKKLNLEEWIQNSASRIEKSEAEMASMRLEYSNC